MSQSRMLSFEIDFADSRNGPISSMAVFQGHLGSLGCPGAPIRAQKGSGFVEMPRIKVLPPQRPAELSKMLTFDIGFSDSHVRAISALAISQGHLGGRDTPIRVRARKGRGFVEISANQGVEPAEPSRVLTFSSRRHNLIHYF